MEGCQIGGAVFVDAHHATDDRDTRPIGGA